MGSMMGDSKYHAKQGYWLKRSNDVPQLPSVSGCALCRVFWAVEREMDSMLGST